MERKSTFRDENHGKLSQQTKATSTPKSCHTAIFSVSPSISKISDSDYQLMEVDEEETTTNGSDEDWSHSSTSEDPHAMLRKQKEIKWPKFWSALKPRNRYSLYFMIFARPNEPEVVVSELLNVHQRDKQRIVMMVLQLFVDLSGFKRLAIEEVYNFNESNAKEVIKKMETDLIHAETELKQTGKFLFMKDSKFQNVADAAITNFVKHFIISLVQYGFLFELTIFGHIAEFLRCMSASCLNPIRSVGLVFVAKFLTGLLEVYKHMLTFMTHDEENGSPLDDLPLKKNSLENSIDFFYIIFYKNCLLPDKKCYVVKMKLALEMLNWMTLHPNEFIIKKRCLQRVEKLSQDEHQAVRRAALSTCEKLLNSTSEEVHSELKKKIDLILNRVEMRFKDVSIAISVKAVGVFTAAVNRYSDHIEHNQKVTILKLVYHENLTLAEAAANFLGTYFRNRNRDEEQFVGSLTKLVFLKKEFAERLPIFVEACIPSCVELQNWHVIVGMLLNNAIDSSQDPKKPDNNLKYLLEIMKESVRYTLKGKCSKSRLTVEESVQPRSEHVKVARAVIPHFEQLILTFQLDKKCLCQLLEMLTFINFEYCSEDMSNRLCISIFDLLKDFFQMTTDQALMEGTCAVFHQMSESETDNPVLTERLDTLKQFYVNTLLADLRQLTPTSDRSLLVRLRETSMKLSVLFSKFNLTDIVKWVDIFQVWDNNHLRVLKYLIVCCKWHLVWNLHSFLKVQEQNDGRDILLLQNCKEFVYGCLDMLKASDNMPLSFLIFETICDFYGHFGKELRKKRQLARFIIEISEPAAYDVLMKFLVHHVVEKNTLPLIQRQKYVSDVVDIICINAVPLECVTTILRYYHSHVEEFGRIIDYFLEQHQLENLALPLLVLHTLVVFYNEMLEKRRAINIISEDAKQLKALAKHFANAMKSQNHCLKLVSNAMNFAFQNEDNYTFLWFVKPFALNLNAEKKNEAYDLFKQLVPDKDKENDVVLMFAGFLKPSKQGKVRV